MNALAGAHDAVVQMIDTSIIRAHQHGACITRNRRQSIGQSRGGLTARFMRWSITNGLPVRLALTAGEADDNRLAGISIAALYVDAVNYEGFIVAPRPRLSLQSPQSFMNRQTFHLESGCKIIRIDRPDVAVTSA
jgi:hypothetical protein